MKIDKRTWIITSIVGFIPIVIGIFLYRQLPDIMPIHWGVDGQANGYASKFVATFIFPGLLFILTLLMPFLMKLDPKYDNMSPALRNVVCWIIPVINIVCSGATLGESLGYDTPVELIIPLLVGIMFVIIGNYLPKTKQSYTMGIKLPWTLDSEENWNKTHRLAGFIWVLGGLATILISLIGIKLWAFVAIICIMVFVPTVYSYLYYRKNRKNSSED